MTRIGLAYLRLIALAALLNTGSAFAAMSDADAVDAVEKALGASLSPDEIVELLVEDGRTLQEVGEIVAKASTGDAQIDLARAAICAATDAQEAEDVGNRAKLVVGQGIAAEEIEGIIETFQTTRCIAFADRRVAPPIYSPSNTGVQGGGTIPPGSPSN
jgi:hypothetical protein